MRKITAYNLVKAISLLPKNRDYDYIGKSSKRKIHIDDVKLPVGPIKIRRWTPYDNQTYKNAKVESISSEMVWRVANAINEGEPINVDRILGGSYNTRSVLETLIALTPEFYYCYPGRVMDMDGHTTIEHGHKHLVWQPNEPHEMGALHEKKMENMAISEIPTRMVTYDNLRLPDSMIAGGDIDIAVLRRHTQIQIALYLIGRQLGYRTWIAQNDLGIHYKEKALVEYPGVVKNLNDENILAAFQGAVSSAKFIDCIWFQDHRFMPAVMEIEHTTGITSGLTRMKGLQEMIPAINTRYVIVAPDEDREKVVNEVNRMQFSDLEARYFPYSAVEELYYICNNRKLRGVTQEFLDCYMEKVCL